MQVCYACNKSTNEQKVNLICIDCLLQSKGHYWKCNFPITPSVRRSISRLVGRSVCHNFLKRQHVTLPCFYRSTYFSRSLSYFVITKWLETVPTVQAVPGFCVSWLALRSLLGRGPAQGCPRSHCSRQHA